MFHGRGMQTFPEDVSYDGEYFEGLRHGRGIYKFSDKSVYHGDWKNDMMTGSGKIEWPNGN